MPGQQHHADAGRPRARRSRAAPGQGPTSAIRPSASTDEHAVRLVARAARGERREHTRPEHERRSDGRSGARHVGRRRVHGAAYDDGPPTTRHRRPRGDPRCTLCSTTDPMLAGRRAAGRRGLAPGVAAQEPSEPAAGGRPRRVRRADADEVSAALGMTLAVADRRRHRLRVRRRLLERAVHVAVHRSTGTRHRQELDRVPVLRDRVAGAVGPPMRDRRSRWQRHGSYIARRLHGHAAVRRDRARRPAHPPAGRRPGGGRGQAGGAHRPRRARPAALSAPCHAPPSRSPRHVPTFERRRRPRGAHARPRSAAPT